VPHEEDDFVEGLEWAESLGAQIFTASLGYSAWYDQYEDMDGQTAVTSVAAATAVENGLIFFNSAGNEGPEPMSVSAPADADGVIAVGALQLDGQIAGFSSRGPSSDWRLKPDVSAPGQDVFVANPHDMDGYQASSGTSFAGPLTAGLAALLLEAYPDYGPTEMYDLLTSSASMAEMPNNQYGYGLVSGEAAAPLHCTCQDLDEDGYYDEECGGLDCNDADPAVNPDATDVPMDGVDQDCDGADDTELGPSTFAAAGGGCTCHSAAAAGRGTAWLGLLSALLLGLAWRRCAR
jgi:subtilisin family serine protease